MMTATRFSEVFRRALLIGSSLVLALGGCGDDDGEVVDASASDSAADAGKDDAGLGAVEDQCSDDSDCASAQCAQASPDPRCTEGELGQPCGAAGDCASGYCVKGLTNNQTPPWGACSDGQSMTAHCGLDEDCESGHCVPSLIYGCVTGLVGDFCIRNDQCDSGYCTARGPEAIGVCASQALEDTCDDDGDCLPGYCAFDSAATDAGWCTDGTENSWCVLNDDCDSGFCATNGGLEGVCSRRALGSPCLLAGDDQCDEGTCSPSALSVTGYACG